MKKKQVVLAHYYCEAAVQDMADKVGDSLELSLFARDCGADEIIFAGVRFMAETAKILCPQAKVILPHRDSTCSLVTMTDIDKLKKWRQEHADYVHVAYVNSSAEHKTLADWIVTSRNVDDIIASIYAEGKKVIYSPDRNMGAYLNQVYGYDMPLWQAVCQVHEKFNHQELDLLLNSTPGDKFVIAHPESPLPILAKSVYIGSTSQLLEYVKRFSQNPQNSTIIVATEDGILYNMRTARPDLNIMQAPIYEGCQCNSCPYMRMNTVQLVEDALSGNGGIIIDYLSDEIMEKARVPIERMMQFSSKYQNS